MSGHNSRSPEEKQLRSDRFVKLWKEGKFENRRVWTEGLTKKTSEKVAANAKKISDSYTPERRQQYSDYAKAIGHKPPTGSGPNHPNWKGGVTNIYQMLYGNARLSREWKFPILKRDGFTCKHCGDVCDLNVHHDVEKMSAIIEKFRDGRDVTLLSFNEKTELVSRIIDHHVSVPVSGITLCRTCHDAEHVRLRAEKLHETDDDCD